MRQNHVGENVVTDIDTLEELVGQASGLAVDKVISFIDENCREFIKLSPFVVIATSSEQGECDASPRGDKPGFAMVLDEKHLIIPERRGNRRADSLRNILSNPHIGLIFLIPNMEETLRINGKAYITRDENLMQEMAVEGRSPAVGIVVEVEDCFIHCAKAFRRSRLWQPESWISKDELPKAGYILHRHSKFAHMTEDELDRALEDDYRRNLY